jgi:glycosyltransferase involved in cell wall biosynthesis
MKLGIDASNIKAGGGLTHLRGMLDNADPISLGIDKVIVFGGKHINQLEDKDWLEKYIIEELDGSFFEENLFKLFKLGKIAKSKCDILFCPGGNKPAGDIPYVSMSQNMLVFEDIERSRFPWSWTRIRYHILEFLQTKSLSNAKGNIFISNYAKGFITDSNSKIKEIESTVIYHGCSPSFRQAPKKGLSISQYSKNKPFKILYVSIINFYKHQWNVIEGLQKLYEEGYPIELHLVGPAYPQALPLLEEAMEKASDFVKYHGKVPFEEIHNLYKEVDMFLFASTCENMPNILIESMSAGLPIACSNYGPMPEVLRDAGLYFDPTKVEEIYSTTKELIDNPNKRDSLAKKAFEYSKEYSWEKCSKDTFTFLLEVVNKQE